MIATNASWFDVQTTVLVEIGMWPRLVIRIEHLVLTRPR